MKDWQKNPHGAVGNNLARLLFGHTVRDLITRPTINQVWGPLPLNLTRHWEIFLIISLSQKKLRLREVMQPVPGNTSSGMAQIWTHAYLSEKLFSLYLTSLCCLWIWITLNNWWNRVCKGMKRWNTGNFLTVGFYALQYYICGRWHFKCQFFQPILIVWKKCNLYLGLGWRGCRDRGATIRVWVLAPEGLTLILSLARE